MSAETTVDETRALSQQAVTSLLQRSAAYEALEPVVRRDLAQHMTRIASYLAQPDGIRLPSDAHGMAVTGMTLSAVDFPGFVADLIDGVFDAIVDASTQQMEAYSKLLAEVAKSIDQFADENVAHDEARDWLAEQYPDVFETHPEEGGRCLRVRAGTDPRAALFHINGVANLRHPLADLNDKTIEAELIPLARAQIAKSRQQLLATMVMMGVNRIVVSDGK